VSPDRGPSDRPTPRTPWLPLVASAIVVPTVLAGFTLLWPRTQIQDTLTDRAGAALSAAGISGATVSFDGRDATISGVSAAEAAQAVQAVEGATGVRFAQVAGAGGAAAAAPTSTATATSETAPTSTSAATSAAAPSSTPPVTSTPTPAPAPGGGELDAAAKQALQAKITALTNAAPITFGGDSPQLTPQGQATLAKVLPLALGAPGARLEVDGFVATGRGNGQLTAQQLSDQRAATVRDALVAGGVPADHLTVRGRGEDTASADRARGRRADITVV
jgi:outer membrane protein OmpA-like peptidoglycan-associated protein